MADKVFKKNDKTMITPHFSAREFDCKCGGDHNTCVNTELVEGLEALFDRLDCGKIIINSGYRCPQHDKRVGGSGDGTHTRGIAADIVCYDKKNKIIPVSDVCCAAQDIGFTGIANIDKTYTATHVDVRKNGTWYGDEAVPGGTSGSVTDDFYDYYGKGRVVDETIKITIEFGGKKYKGELKPE